MTRLAASGVPSRESRRLFPGMGPKSWHRHPACASGGEIQARSPMPPNSPSGRSSRFVALIAGLMVFSAGCVQEVAQKKVAPIYIPTAHPADLPAYLKGSLYDRTFVLNNEPFNVSAFSLVGQLRGTGSCVVPPSIRSYMIKELYRRGFGNPQVPVYGQIQPAEVLADPNYAIVRVDGEIPPGAREGDWFDVRVSTLPGNPTRSLAHGVLFETDLKNNGADKNNPVGAINVLATCKGPILVNPAYALTDGTNPTGPARTSLRSGVVMFNGVIKQDRPLFLQLRDPQRSTARLIENRLWDCFHDFPSPPLRTKASSPSRSPGTITAIGSILSASCSTCSSIPRRNSTPPRPRNWSLRPTSPTPPWTTSATAGRVWARTRCRSFFRC